MFEMAAQPIIFHKATQNPTKAKIAIIAMIISNELGLLDWAIKPPEGARRKPKRILGVKPKIQKNYMCPLGLRDAGESLFEPQRLLVGTRFRVAWMREVRPYRCASTIRRRTGKSVFGISTAE